MKTIFYFLIEQPEAGLSMTWAGGGLRVSKKPGHVWLTTPDGRPVMEVLREHVSPTTPEATAARIAADHRASKAPLN